MSFDEDKLADNITAFVEQVRARQAGRRQGQLHQVDHAVGTMSPGVPLPM